MDQKENSNWWHFSIDPTKRKAKIMNSPEGLQEINPFVEGKRQIIDYHTYVGLDKLLTSQYPSSMIPDERVFIVTHQLFEITFKMIAFDIAVVSETLKQLFEIKDDEKFHSLCTTSIANDAFWQPALTASGRIKYSARVLLPAFIGYLLNTENKDETFNSLEYYSFRDYLPPASGFQTAQFRLIQRAFGKTNLLNIKLYPGGDYWKNYEGKDLQTPVRPTDPVILRGDAWIPNPPEESPLQAVAELDERAHRVLERLSIFSETSEAEISAVPTISADDTEQAVDGFRRILTNHRGQQERAGKKPANADEVDNAAEKIFRESFEQAVKIENARRAKLISARKGALYLHFMSPRSHLAQVFNRMTSTDSALHGKQDDSFLSLHYQMAKETIQDIYEYTKKIGEPEPASGTGGAGVPYLGNARKNIIPLFPALIAYLDLEESPAFSWIE